MEQTAVEWLESQLFELRNPTLNQIEILKQAKEMEKLQQEFIFECGRHYQLTGEGTFKQVYNETFKD
jgi:hypothetical protein